MAVKSYNNNIFKVISEIDKKNYDFFKLYTDEQYKELQPYTLLRWISSVQGSDEKISESYILKANNLVNNYMFNLSEHKELLLNLLCCCGSNKWVKHAWIPINNKKVDKNDSLLKDFYKLSDDEWTIKKEKITKDEIEEVLQFLGKADSKR